MDTYPARVVGPRTRSGIRGVVIVAAAASMSGCYLLQRTAMTAEEEAALSFIQGHADRVIQVQTASSERMKARLGSSEDENDAAEAVGEMWDATIGAMTEAISSLNAAEPPPLLNELHRIEVESWKNLRHTWILTRSEAMAAARQLLRQASAGQTPHWPPAGGTPVLNLSDILVAEVNATYETARHTAFAIIRDSLRARRGGGSVTNRWLEVQPVLSFEPYLVPVRIELRGGRISVTAEARVTTLVGVFAIGTEVAVPGQTRRLTVRHGDRDHVYALENEPFFVDLTSMRARVSISYDGRGGTTVELLE